MAENKKFDLFKIYIKVWDSSLELVINWGIWTFDRISVESEMHGSHHLFDLVNRRKLSFIIVMLSQLYMQRTLQGCRVFYRSNLQYCFLIHCYNSPEVVF